jgi:enediyne biosynthesis protein CalE5
MVDTDNEGLLWQVGVWNRMAEIYQQEIDSRFGPVVESVLSRVDLRTGASVLDLGTGTGAVAIVAASRVGPSGRVIAVDISPEMLETARTRVRGHALSNIDLVEGRAEAIPAGDESVDAVLASLSLMYVIDRDAAAHEIARVLKPGGRFVASVWAGPDEADIVRFQQTAGSFAPTPPVGGVGPGALADPREFLSQLESAGLSAKSETVVTEFVFDSFGDAWDTLAGVTTAALDPAMQERAKAAVREVMWTDPNSARLFRNGTQLITAAKPG